MADPTTLSAMINKANQVMKNAYVPQSHFPVGACLLTTEGELFAGCNVENISYSLTLCAESSAIANMIASGHKKIAEIIVIAQNSLECPPCGSCLQRIQEFSTPSTLIHWCDSTGDNLCSHPISELLPIPFQVECLLETADV